uniref:Murine leukemia virus integrase C-terminal domain-containing protein n=1 Tax=Astatotilapia calliptera TaxID=8154 RepID=A0A3P8RD63_ASTCA
MFCLSQPLPSTDPTHKWRPGDAVLVKSLKPRTLGEAAFSSPQTVLAVTRTSILTDGQPQWIHASRVKTSPIGPSQASDQTPLINPFMHPIEQESTPGTKMPEQPLVI